MKKEIVEIQPPFKPEHLELGYSGKMLKCGDWYIQIGKNRGRIPWIVNLGRFIKEDKELDMGWILDWKKEDNYLNGYTDETVKFVNDTMNKSRISKIAKRLINR